MVIKRGDIFYADLRPVVGSEQGGIRPVLIIQNNVGNRHSPTVICAAITSKMNKAKLGLNPEHNNTRVTWSACRDLKALRAQCHRVPPPFMQAASLLLPPWPQ